MRQRLDTSERRTCKTIGLARSTHQYKAVSRDDNDLRLALIRLAKQYGRYGYRKVAELLRMEGWRVNHKKVERLWREEGLQLPQRHKKRKRLYHKDGSINRLRHHPAQSIYFLDDVALTDSADRWITGHLSDRFDACLLYTSPSPRD